MTLLARLTLATCLMLAPPALAQDGTSPTDPPPQEGVDLIERGAGILFRHLFNQMAPEIEGLSRDLSDAMELLGPAVSDLALLVDDMANYDTPERLENGDIIIRRKSGAPPPPPIGEGLKRFTEPGENSDLPIDPTAPQIEL